MVCKVVAGVSLLVGAVVCGTPGAHAADADRLLDLTQPSVVAEALREAGYKGELKTNDKGEPYVLSAANGSQFTIEFYDCKGPKGLSGCTSYQFASWYKAEPVFTAQVANDWNVDKRFLKVAIDKDGNLNEWMDFSAIGKTTFANFADQVDWYQAMDSDLAKFLVERRDQKKK